MRKTEVLLFALLLTALLPLEVACAFLSHYTLGEMGQFVSFVAFSSNLPFVALAWRERAAAALGVALIGILLIPYQVFLGARLVRVREEAARVVTYAYEHKARTGAFPPDLRGYRFHDAGVARFIQGYEAGDDVRGGMRLVFRVGTPTTSHWYSPDGGWGYYPD